MNQDNCRDRAEIGRSIDAGEQLSEQLLAKLDDDASLKRFYDLSVKISNDLRCSSDRWALQHRVAQAGSPATSRSRLSTDSPRVSSSSGSQPRGETSRPRVVALGLSSAALLLLGLGWLAWGGSGGQPVPLVVTQEKQLLNQEKRLLTQEKRLRTQEKTEALKVASEPGAQGMEGTTNKLDRLSGSEVAMLRSGDPASVSQLQFEDYFYLTVESALETLQTVSETLADRAVCQPLQRTVDSAMQLENVSALAEPAAVQDIDDANRLAPKQAQLVREFLMTTDFLVEKLPREATRSWMELSYSYNRSR
jgi:hypothetical protein